MDDGVIIFIPYGSRLGFHVGGPASTMANIDYKFPQCVCYEVQMDEGVICFRGKAHPMHRSGYQEWEITEVADTLNVYDNSEAKTPIVIFSKHKNAMNCMTPWENQARRVYSVDGAFPTLQAREKSGLDSQAVCYAVDSHPEDSRFKLDGEEEKYAVYDARGNGEGGCVRH